MTEVESRRSASRIRTRRATVADLPTLALIHKLAYSRSHFTALLPNEVLARYYGYFLDGGSEICLALGNADDCKQMNLVAEEVHGFAVYGLGIPGRIAQFKRECSKEILSTSLRHPLIAARKAMVGTFARLARRPAYPPADFLLLSIAVALPRRGIGSHLLSALLDAARQRGCKAVGLYVNAHNVSAINAYFSAGFVVMGFQGGQFYMEQTFEKA